MLNDTSVRINTKRELIKRLAVRPGRSLTQIDKGRFERCETFSRSVRPRKFVMFQSDCAAEWVAHREERFGETIFSHCARRIFLRAERDSIKILTSKTFKGRDQVCADSLRNLKY